MEDMSFQKASLPEVELRKPRVSKPIHLKDVRAHVQSISDNDASSNQGVATKTLKASSTGTFELKNVRFEVLRQVCCHLDTESLLKMVQLNKKTKREVEKMEDLWLFHST
jgi:DNA-binding Xre family transcriptional regulator